MSETIADRRLHPATLVSQSLRAIPQSAGGMAAYATFIADAEGAAEILGFILLGLLVAGGIAFLGWWRFRYGVGDREIVIESGVIRRRRRVIPFERVQDIAIERRLLARLFGTAHVKIETGGSAADEGHLDSIALADAERLRDHIRGRAATAAAEGEAAAPAGDEPLLFGMGLGRVLYSGLFNFSLVFVAAIAAVLQNVEELGLWKPGDLPPELVDRLGAVWIAASLLFGATLLLLGFAAGVLRTLLRDFGYRLTRAPNGFRRRRGLVTLSETVIPIRRIQVASLGQGLVMRALGWHRLDFQTLGADPKERGAQVAAPFARIGEVRPILAEAGYPDDGDARDWRRGPARSILRRALAPLAAALSLAVAGRFVEPLVFIPAAFFLLAALAAPVRWHRHRHTPGDTALFVRAGAMSHRIRIMPFERAQAIAVTSGPLQRLLRLATVRVDTAGARGNGGIRVVDLDEQDARALSERLLILFRERRALLRAARTDLIHSGSAPYGGGGQFDNSLPPE